MQSVSARLTIMPDARRILFRRDFHVKDRNSDTINGTSHANMVKSLDCRATNWA